jgi:hypothetical protein
MSKVQDGIPPAYSNFQVRLATAGEVEALLKKMASVAEAVGARCGFNCEVYRNVYSLFSGNFAAVKARAVFEFL